VARLITVLLLALGIPFSILWMLSAAGAPSGTVEFLLFFVIGSVLASMFWSGTSAGHT